jgi:hypothetical protein
MFGTYLGNEPSKRVERSELAQCSSRARSPATGVQAFFDTNGSNAAQPSYQELANHQAHLP